MTKVGDGRASYKSSRARGKNCKRPFRPGAVCISLNLFKQFINSTAPTSSKAKVGLGRAPSKNRVKICKRSFQPDIKEDPWNVSEEAEQNVVEAYKHSPRQGSNLITNKTPRKGPKTPSMALNLYLPDELLSNIFIRLLAKQLAQMRSVSKSWNALLSQPSFIKSHLKRSIHNHDGILLFFHGKRISSSESNLFTAKSTLSPHLKLTNFIKLPPVVNPESEGGIRVIGSVNGLICSSDKNKSVIQIWNPSLSSVLTLPPYSFPASRGDNRFKIQFRFGYDPKTDDYKVVKFIGLRGSMFSITRWLQVEIYSMRKGYWELINGRFPSHYINVTNCEHVCVDGHDGYLHWLGCKPDDVTTLERIIIAFDLGSETFSEIPMPESLLDIHCANVIGVLGGKLCVMSSSTMVPRKNDAYEVWVMEEYGVVESWVKRHVYTRLEGCTYPFGITSRGEFLMEGDGFLVLYDPSANQQKVLEDYCPEEYSVDRIVEYVDSLVWVAPDEHEMVDGGGQSSNGEM